MASVRGKLIMSIRGAFSSRLDAKALMIWQNGILATGLLAISTFDSSGIIVCGSLFLLGLGFVLSVCPWPGEGRPAIDLLTGDMRCLLAKSQRTYTMLYFAVAVFAACLGAYDPDVVWFAVAVGGPFAAWGLQAGAGLLFIHHDIQRLAVWTLCAQGSALLATAVWFEGGTGLAMGGVLLLALSLRRTRSADPDREEPTGSAIKLI